MAAKLVAAVADRQDRTAFTQLFAFYAPRVKGMMMRMGATDASADELAQDVMLTVWRKAALFDPGQASVSTWVYRIARNRRIDLSRREKRMRDELENELEEPRLSAEPPTRPDEDLAALDREERVGAALAALPEKQAELVRIAFFEDISHREIAERLDLPLGTVKSRLRLAFGRLRQALEGVDV